MTGSDDYQSVLGIPPGPRPPNHYELLGLELFEADRERIVAAFERRVGQAERCIDLPEERIRPLIQEMQLAKTCLLGQQTKATYDRHLNHRIVGASDILLLEPPVVATPAVEEDDRPIEIDRSQDKNDAQVEADAQDDDSTFEAPTFEQPQFHEGSLEDVSIAAIGGGRSDRKRKPKSRRLFWTVTAVECLIVVAAFYYLRYRRQEAEQPPEIVVVQPKDRPAPQNDPQAKPAESQRRQLADRPRESPPSPPGNPFVPSPAPNQSPPGPSPDSIDAPSESSVPSPAPMPAPKVEAEEKQPEAPLVPLPAPPANHAPPLASGWTLRFPASGDWTLDDDLLKLSEEEKKAIAGLAQQEVFTVRDTTTKKPIAILPYDPNDAGGYPSGIAVALLPPGDYHAALTYSDHVLQGRTWVFNEAGQCIWFADYRNKNRKMLCLVDNGAPLVVQIWRAKNADVYFIDRDQGKPVAIKQSDLKAEQAERLAPALERLRGIETLVGDSEKGWKRELSKWWNKNDKALRLNPAGRVAILKQLFDEQHDKLDPLLKKF